jgi:predicted unusual protein kinase regulating ubiquinone biosynthesis (AarF/ABC1/UbiB family)
VADYYVHTAQSSPYVRLQSYLANDERDDETRKSKKRAKLDELHEKHAPDILQVMLDLKGLYIKLGQGKF